MGLKVSHVKSVFKIADADQRLELLEQAANEGWSVIKLRSKVNLIAPLRHYGGRTTSDKSIPQALEELRNLCQKVEAHVDILEAHDFWGLRRKTIKKLKEFANLARRLKSQLTEDRP